MKSSTDDDEILIGEGWSLIAEGEESWRPGGDEFISAHQELGLRYVAMHEGASIPTISMVTRFGCLTLRPDSAFTAMRWKPRCGA